MSLLGTFLGGLGLSKGIGFLSDSVINPVANGIGNLISGGTWRQSGSEVASQEFAASEAVKAHERSVEADATKYQRAVEDLEEAGLNPALVYGSGGVSAQGPTSSSAAAGSGRSARMQNDMNVLGEVSQLMNSVTNARALDHQINKNSKNITTQRIYNSVGELVSTLVKTVK